MRFRFCGDLDCPDWVLSEVATLSKMTSVRVKILATQVVSNCLYGKFDTEKVMKLASGTEEGLSDIRGSIAVIHFMIMNAARFDLDESSLLQEIQQLGLPKENSEAVARQFREHKDLLRTQLAEDSYRIAKLLSTEWRIDEVVASSSSSPAPSALETAPIGNDEELRTGSLVHLKLTIDTAPHLRDIKNRAESTTGQDSSDGVEDLAFEVQLEKLAMLVKELEAAKLVMSNTL